MYLLALTTAGLSLSPGAGAAEVCAGCPQESEVNTEIVNFVTAQLNFGECQKSNMKIENFKSQVRTIILHKVFIRVILKESKRINKTNTPCPNNCSNVD